MDQPHLRNGLIAITFHGNRASARILYEMAYINIAIFPRARFVTYEESDERWAVPLGMARAQQVPLEYGIPLQAKWLHEKMPDCVAIVDGMDADVPTDEMLTVVVSLLLDVPPIERGYIPSRLFGYASGAD